MDFSQIMNQVLILFIPVVIGYIISKTKLVDEDFAKNLSAFLFNITLPCIIISSLKFDFKPEMIIKSGLLIVTGTIIIIACWFFGFFLGKILKAQGYVKRIIQFSVTFSNFSFMGYPVAEGFLGSEGLFYATIFSVPIYVLLQSIGMATLMPKKEGDKKFLLSYVLNPPLIGVYIGLLLFFLQIKLPHVIDKTIDSLGFLTTPLSMILAGLVITKAPLKNAFTNIKIYIVALFRLIIIPLFIYYILKSFNLDEITTKLPVIISMMPVAANLIIVTTNFEGDVPSAAQYVLLSTLLSLVTIPLMGYILF